MCMVSALRSPQACVCSVSSTSHDWEIQEDRTLNLSVTQSRLLLSLTVASQLPFTVSFQFDTASCWQSFLHRTPHKHSFNMLKLL
jgi:hypothetical protein